MTLPKLSWNKPCVRTIFDTGELTLGSQSFKLLKQAWIQYLCSGGISVTFYRDYGQQFFVQTLPAHTSRDEERFFLPDAVGSVLNKTRTTRLVFASTNPTIGFKLYFEGSRLEWLDMSGDQRKSYSQMTLSMMTSPTGSQ